MTVTAIGGLRIPTPETHAAIVLRGGTRYVGHLVELSDDARVLRFKEGKSRTIDIRTEEIAAIEQFSVTRDAMFSCDEPGCARRASAAS